MAPDERRGRISARRRAPARGSDPLAVDDGRRTPAFWLLRSQHRVLAGRPTRAYNLALLKGTFDYQLSYDAGWIFYYLLWGAAALHPSMRSLEEPAEDRERV